MENQEIIRKLDAALLRMELRGHKATLHYARLLSKRDAVLSNLPYAYVDVTQEVIATVGAMVPRINKTTKMYKTKTRTHRA